MFSLTYICKLVLYKQNIQWALQKIFFSLQKKSHIVELTSVNQVWTGWPTVYFSLLPFHWQWQVQCVDMRHSSTWLPCALWPISFTQHQNSIKVEVKTSTGDKWPFRSGSRENLSFQGGKGNENSIDNKKDYPLPGFSICNSTSKKQQEWLWLWVAVLEAWYLSVWSNALYLCNTIFS